MALKFTVSDSTGGLTWDHSDAELTHAEAQIVVSANIAHWLHSIAEALSEIAQAMREQSELKDVVETADNGRYRRPE